MRSVVVHYHELALKGKNRPLFEKALIANLRKASRGRGVREVKKHSGRLELVLDEEASWEDLRERVGRVFGVANFSLATKTPLDLEALKTAIGQEIKTYRFTSFRVAAKRGDKEFPLTSVEINREVGAYLKGLTQARVDLENPDLTVFIEILPREAFFYWDKIPGPGGLPTGVSGHVACLISGGIDSPVAAYRMMKRGARVTFIHFHSHPLLSKASQEKAVELVTHLTRYQYASRLYLVPFGEVQRQVVVGAPPPLRVVLYRRLMVRIAGEIARKNRAAALVTGESLGQVASQTLQNIVTIEEASGLPILRPLIGMDKDEITEEAKAIGTYETSIQPDQDCCQLFIPKRPATRSTVEEITAAEKTLEIDRLVEMALEKVEVRDFTYPD